VINYTELSLLKADHKVAILHVFPNEEYYQRSSATDDCKMHGYSVALKKCLPMAVCTDLHLKVTKILLSSQDDLS
jgi:hypothetical protein